MQTVVGSETACLEHLSVDTAQCRPTLLCSRLMLDMVCGARCTTSTGGHRARRALLLHSSLPRGCRARIQLVATSLRGLCGSLHRFAFQALTSFKQTKPSVPPPPGKLTTSTTGVGFLGATLLFFKLGAKQPAGADLQVCFLTRAGSSCFLLTFFLSQFTAIGAVSGSLFRPFPSGISKKQIAVRTPSSFTAQSK